MINSINCFTIANEVRQRSQRRSDIFVISETSRYDDFIRHLFGKKRNIIIAHRQQNVIGALEILQNDGYKNVYAYLESSIDVNLHANLIPKILAASNLSNQPARQELISLSKGNQHANSDCDTDTSIDKISESSVDHKTAEPIELSDTSPQSADDILVALEEALKTEHSEQAIKLAQLGAKLFPDNARLSRMAKVLAPPVIRVSQKQYKRSLDTSRKWLRENAQQYRGQWVAVCEGVLVGHAPTVKALMAELGPNIDRDSTLITKVL